MAVFDSRPNTHPIHNRSYIKGNTMKASQIESIQSALARIQQQKGRRLTAGERLFITNHQVAHALVNIRIDGYPIAETMGDFYCYIDVNYALARSEGNRFHKDIQCWPFDAAAYDYVPDGHDLEQYRRLPSGGSEFIAEHLFEHIYYTYRKPVTKL